MRAGYARRRSRHGPASRCRRRSCSCSSPTAPARSAARLGAGLLHGLKLVAVAIVAQAVWGMARTLCPDRERASIAVVAALIISVQQLVGRRRSAAILLGRHRRAVALPGRAADADRTHRRCRCRAAPGFVALAAFFVLARRRFRCCARSGLRTASRCSTHSIAPARWCSAAAMSCCRCCARRSSRRAGSATMRSSPATARRRPCRDRCSPSPPISAPSSSRRRTASPARRSA